MKWIKLQPDDPLQIDALFEEKRLFIIGCNPFLHYEGVESIHPDVYERGKNV